jgi:hypothetical protein
MTFQLNDQENAVVGQCLRAAVEGPFIPDWEFQTLIGLSREEVRQVAAAWPPQEAADEVVLNTVVGVLNNLLGYPHGQDSAWRSYVAVEQGVVSALLEKILVQQRHP